MPAKHVVHQVQKFRGSHCGLVSQAPEGKSSNSTIDHVTQLCKSSFSLSLSSVMLRVKCIYQFARPVAPD